MLLVAVHAQKKMFMVSCAWAKTEDAGPALHFFMYWAAARPGLAHLFLKSLGPARPGPS